MQVKVTSDEGSAPQSAANMITELEAQKHKHIAADQLDEAAAVKRLINHLTELELQKQRHIAADELAEAAAVKLQIQMLPAAHSGSHVAELSLPKQNLIGLDDLDKTAAVEQQVEELAAITEAASNTTELAPSSITQPFDALGDSEQSNQAIARDDSAIVSKLVEFAMHEAIEKAEDTSVDQASERSSNDCEAKLSALELQAEIAEKEAAVSAAEALQHQLQQERDAALQREKELLAQLDSNKAKLQQELHTQIAESEAAATLTVAHQKQLEQERDDALQREKCLIELACIELESYDASRGEMQACLPLMHHSFLTRCKLLFLLDTLAKRPYEQTPFSHRTVSFITSGFSVCLSHDHLLHVLLCVSLYFSLCVSLCISHKASNCVSHCVSASHFISHCVSLCISHKASHCVSHRV